MSDAQLRTYERRSIELIDSILCPPPVNIHSSVGTYLSSIFVYIRCKLRKFKLHNLVMINFIKSKFNKTDLFFFFMIYFINTFVK